MEEGGGGWRREEGGGGRRREEEGGGGGGGGGEGGGGVVYGESCTEVMKAYDNYNILLSAVVDEDGNYVICDNSVSEHDNLYEEIEDLDDNEIESIKNSLEEKGEGVFVWKDENDRNLVYDYGEINSLVVI